MLIDWEQMGTVKRCQIAFDVQPEIRKEIKMRAAQRGISMNLWIMRAIYYALKTEGGRNKQPPPETDER